VKHTPSCKYITEEEAAAAAVEVRFIHRALQHNTQPDAQLATMHNC